MFGGDTVPPKNIRRQKPCPMRQDIQLPGTKAGTYQHIGREPNTDYAVRLLHYKQKKDAEYRLREQLDAKSRLNDAITIKYDKHAEKKQINRQIQQRFEEKLRHYEETVEERREKLRNLLYDEERQFYYETVEMAQKGDEIKVEEMKKRTSLLRAQREEERLKMVHQKRIEQYRNRCQELRPSLIKKHLIESKNCQLQQMRENEARREAEKELDIMWYQLTAKEVKAKMDREQQELLIRKQKERGLQETWEKQIRGKEELKAEHDRISKEDRLEMIKMAERIRREEIDALDAKRRKRDQVAKEILEQIAAQEEYHRKHKETEEALDQAFNDLAAEEYQREKEAIKDETIQAGREMAMYRKHLKELKEERLREEQELEQLLEVHRREIEKKQDEAKCKLVEARQALQKSVMEGRAEQIMHKQQEAEQQLRLKEAENELLRITFENNERLQAESDRLEMEAVRQYREDLKMQIEYNNKLREEERKELERQLKKGVEEEEEYRRIVDAMVAQNLESISTHPFRRVMERYDCRC